MKKLLGLGVILAAVLIGLWQFHGTPSPVGPVAPVAVPDIGPAVEPTPAPLEPWIEPTMWPHWPSCSSRPMVQAQEDAALRAVLASPLTDDPLFGGSEMRMEAAECAARRWRLEDR